MPSLTSSSRSARRPSATWLFVSIVCGILALVSLAAAVIYQRNATRPIGEGEVFAADALAATEILAGAEDRGAAVRKARNGLEVESVSIVDTDGQIVASSSPPMVGQTVSNPLLSFGVASGRFMALASPIDQAIRIDGVPEWSAGSVLYQVVAPMGDGESILLHYDLADLLSRRSQPGDIQTETLQLVGLAAIFALLGGTVAVGHFRAARRYREVAWESEVLRQHSAELELANRELRKARSQAEAALELAEEKMRIRSEFVLMINHELRTPLTSVVTGAELLRDRSLDGVDTEGLLSGMVSDGRRLQEIIDQILAVARIENRGLAYEMAEIPLEKVCATLLESHSALESDHDEVRHAPGVVVSTDLSTLAIVVASLADNAITHGASRVGLTCGTTPTVEPQITVGEKPASAVYIKVADDGPGISPGFLPRVFEKFEKSSFSSGTGLGLYMVRLMVEALGGSVGVTTSPQGTGFEIAIPAAFSEELAWAR